MWPYLVKEQGQTVGSVLGVCGAVELLLHSISLGIQGLGLADLLIEGQSRRFVSCDLRTEMNEHIFFTLHCHWVSNVSEIRLPCREARFPTIFRKEK